jgi:phage terminase small subunit
MADVEARGEIIIAVSKDKYGNPVEREKKNPWLVVAVEAEKAMTGYLDRLGFTPVNRERCKPVKKDEVNKPFEPGTIGWMLEQSKLERAATSNEN